MVQTAVLEAASDPPDGASGNVDVLHSQITPVPTVVAVLIIAGSSAALWFGIWRLAATIL